VAEDAAVAAKRRRAFLHPGPAGLDESDHRDAGTLRGLQHADDRVGVTFAERAA